MNQAYFTFCCSGEGNSLSGLGGDRVRAAVNGASESGLTIFKQYCNYPQYSQTSKNKQEQETAFNPESIAKLVFGKAETGTGDQRFLAHSVYAAPDKETLREGNYFSHLIYPVPDSWSIRTALEMWGSPFWVTQDCDDISPELPSIDENEIPFGIINETSFVEFLRSSPERQKKFLFLLKSLLTLKPSDKIVLIGLPEDAAFCLWGATRCLPLQIWNNLTFSTHEKPTLSFSFDVVNYPLLSTLENQEEYIIRELPRRQNILFYSGIPEIQSSDLPDIPLADDFLEISINGKFQILDDFYMTVPKQWKNSCDALQLFWMFTNHPEQISFYDIAAVMQVPELKNQAIELFMDASRFSLDQQLEYYDILDSSKQDVLLNRLMTENTIEQIRNNERYSELLISTLKKPEKIVTPEIEKSLFEKIIEKIIDILNWRIF